MIETGNGFTSTQLALEAQSLLLPSLSHAEALMIGEIAVELGRVRVLPIAVEVRLDDWSVFHTSLPGSTATNDWWMARKARVVMAKGTSTLYERVVAEESGINWYEQNGVSEELYAVHGGGLPLITKNEGFVGVLLISGLPQVDDHLLGVEVLTEFLARKGELL